MHHSGSPLSNLNLSKDCPDLKVGPLLHFSKGFAAPLTEFKIQDPPPQTRSPPLSIYGANCQQTTRPVCLAALPFSNEVHCPWNFPGRVVGPQSKRKSRSPAFTR